MNNQQPISNIEHSMPHTRRSIGCWVFNVGRSMFSTM
jgi:hypothetical protein